MNNYLKDWVGMPELELRVLMLEDEIQKLAEWKNRYEIDIAKLASIVLDKKKEVAPKKAAKKKERK